MAVTEAIVAIKRGCLAARAKLPAAMLPAATPLAGPSPAGVTYRAGIPGLIAIAMLAGCGPVAAPPGGDAYTSGGPEPVASDAPANLDRGELLSFACQACHTFEPGGRHNIGPNLFGIFGQPAAAQTGFGYSDALSNSGIVWSAAAIDRWLRDPTGFVAGSSMTFAGYADADDRRDLIAYLTATLVPPEPRPATPAGR